VQSWPASHHAATQVLGTAKNAIVVWIGIVFLGEAVTPLQGGGYAVSLAGFFVYNYLKMQQPAGAAHSRGADGGMSGAFTLPSHTAAFSVALGLR
jgi:hypothetical protein